jgi:predicted Fe-Mo cluster-binding NifX family protein
MRLLIPTTDTNGTVAQLSGHFGRAPHYTVADTETGAVVAVANPSVAYSHGECVPGSEVFGQDGFDAVVCQAIGRGAISRLARRACPSTYIRALTSLGQSRLSEAARCLSRAQTTAALARVRAAGTGTTTRTRSYGRGG